MACLYHLEKLSVIIVENKVILILTHYHCTCTLQDTSCVKSSSRHDEVDPTKCEVAVAHVWNTHRTCLQLQTSWIFHDSKQVDSYVVPVFEREARV